MLSSLIGSPRATQSVYSNYSVIRVETEHRSPSQPSRGETSNCQRVLIARNANNVAEDLGAHSGTQERVTERTAGYPGLQDKQVFRSSQLLSHERMVGYIARLSRYNPKRSGMTSA